MKRILQSAVLSAVLCGAVSAGDDLDAKLAELKQKARHRTYSSRAQLQDQGLTVPSEPAEKEKLLDAKLQVMERKLQAEAPIRPLRPPIRPLPRREENPNWLTPALLDKDAAQTDPIENNNSWITSELDRRKSRQLEIDDRAKEEKLIGQKVTQELNKPGASPLNPANTYNRSLQDIISGRPAEEPQSPAQRYRTASAAENPFSMQRSSSQPLFSPGSGLNPSARKSASGKKHPFEIERKPLSTPSDFRSTWKKSEPEPLAPLKRLRKSTLDNDPFTDDFAPKLNKSIWD